MSEEIKSIVQSIRENTDPEIIKEIELEKAAEEKKCKELLEKGIVRFTRCDPGDIMRIREKIREKDKDI